MIVCSVLERTQANLPCCVRQKGYSGITGYCAYCIGRISEGLAFDVPDH